MSKRPLVTRKKNSTATASPPVYLDCNATTPVDPEVEEVFIKFIRDEFGNAGSRTHAYGARAKQAVQRARDQVASVVAAQRENIIFTSGATEGNNLAILGLREYGERTSRRHVVTTAIEHKAVLEPLEYLRTQGFTVTIVKPQQNGAVTVDQVTSALQADTLLVSVMHINNETGIIQPIAEIADALKKHDAFFHVDAAQGFGKQIPDLQHQRIDLISISGHKIYAPKGIGALVTRHRGFDRIPLSPLFYGGGQERGLRPGTLPVAMIVALGKAAELSVRDSEKRLKHCRKLKEQALVAFRSVGGILTGDQSKAVPSTLNVAIPGLDSEAAIVALKDLIAISNGSACTSQSYTASHVLQAMGLPTDHIKGALRLSWCHMTPNPPWDQIANRIRTLRF